MTAADGSDPRSPELSAQYLDALGIQRWQLRGAEAEQADAVPEDVPAAVAMPAADPSAGDEAVHESGSAADQLAALSRQVAACTACELHRARQQAVFGVGAVAARWMIVGEGPGAEEDRRGEPFVGRAGQLLNAMLKAAGFDRKDVYIANIVKCRPPSNRDPRPEEAAACAGYLRQQITLVKPALILAVGRVAAQNLLGVSDPLGKLRGRQYAYGDDGPPVVVTYHPAYLLRSPSAKAKAWQDLCMALDVARA
ncbi:MAG: uracil-DNA glycosylase [Pseudomonadota bacterium]